MRFLVFCYVILSTLTLGEDKKIYVVKHVDKPIIRIINNYDQAIFCMVSSKNKVTDFYIQRKSKTVPMAIDLKTFKYWCKLPEKSV